MRKSYPLLFLLLLLTVFSCKRNTSWETEVLTPLVSSKVKLTDALQDSNLVQTNGDNSLTLVFRDTVANLALADYIVVPDTELAATVTLDSLSLSSDTLIQDVTMGDIARQLKSQGNPLGDYILNNQGGSIPFLPTTNGLSSGDVPIDASDFFEEAELKEGQLVIRLENRLPVDIDYVDFLLRNDGQRSDTLAQSIIGPIPKNTDLADTSDLAGRTVESALVGKLVDMSIQGGTNVPIDTNDYLRLVISVENLKAQRATAIFPEQTVINSLSNAKYDFGPDIEVTRLAVKSGVLSIRAISTIQDTLEFVYSLPTAVKDNQPVEVTTLLNPAPPGGQIVNEQDFPLNGYFIDLTDDADSVNIFPQRLIANLKYSGNLVTADLADSIYVYYGLLDIIPSYIEGYLGRETFDFQESVGLDFFNSITGGTLEIMQPKVSLTFLNSIGIDGELQINGITAYNTRNNSSVSLNGPIVSQPSFIPGPRFPNVGQSVTTSLQLNNQNSNIGNIISLLPDSIDFDMSVEVNKNGNPGLRDNFATDKSRIAAFLDMEVPLYGIANNLQLRDTLDFNLEPGTIPEEVLQGQLNLVVQNGFPFSATVQMRFYNAAGMELTRLFDNGPASLAAAPINNAGYVEEPLKSVLSAPFSNEKLQLLQNASTAIIEFSLSTQPNGTPVKIYSNYGIDFTLVGDFKYNVQL